ncbi:4Fe-4S dicluster domain-containing protein [Ruminococcaceae bacterium OttesenSCG-928-A16]|nr:4Fe-4S dicluster domain-containing protein [Ruminococcaceae bacterium OttesenSCG-928-A16]
MAKFYHSVMLEKDKCKGCINCIKRCPTEAIRVQDGKARIMAERCIDCGECIRVCPYHAKKAIYNPLSVMENYKYPIALVEPSMYGQFNNLEETDVVAAALKEIGFAAVYDIARAAELVSEATRLLLAEGKLKKPVISSACPAIARLIRVRFPGLIGNVLPLVPPMELAARLAKRQALAQGVSAADVGCILLTPCPAKATAQRMPIGYAHSEIDAAVAIKKIYPAMLGVMRAGTSSELAQAGRIGFGWGENGGEAAGLISTDAYLAADGMENIVRVLEDLEDAKYQDLEFVELSACAGGCVGGVLQVENPYIAKAKLKKLRRYMPVSLNHLQGAVPTAMMWEENLEYAPVMELGKTRQESFEKYEELERIMHELPELDCGSCGAPTCAAFAEDIVRGNAEMNDCTVLMRDRMEAVLKAIGHDKKKD